MVHFRIYCFDGASRITKADWLEAHDDAEAMREAEKISDCFRVEVWDRNRLVGRREHPAA